MEMFSNLSAQSKLGETFLSGSLANLFLTSALLGSGKSNQHEKCVKRVNQLICLKGVFI